MKIRWSMLSMPIAGSIAGGPAFVAGDDGDADTPEAATGTVDTAAQSAGTPNTTTTIRRDRGIAPTLRDATGQVHQPPTRGHGAATDGRRYHDPRSAAAGRLQE